ncbi:hypothetical protein BBK14_11120 [Parafrankia soli]|uniref:Cell division protein FtsK n=1 Tax=Parafrankia soli TaxID=2599596 RepID=A0A1S1R9K4_9ACTN|nr:hypothetical protein [Parafrankia soli]OHV42165.1 hypothetical protein BBK14_11120 [Parafrankia soli]
MYPERWRQRLTESAAEPVAPLVFRDPRQALASTRYVTSEAARMCIRRALHPWELARILPPIGRGAWRGISRWWRWVAAHDIRDDHIRRPGLKPAGRDEISDNRQFRAAISGGVLFVASIGELVGYLVVGAEVPLLSVLAASAIAGTAGRDRTAERTPALATSGAGLRPGIPTGVLARHVVRGLEASRVTAEPAAPPVQHRWGWTVPVLTEDELTDKTLRALERRLRARRGSITPIPDPDNAAVTALRIVHTDLLGQVGGPPPRPPLSGSITEPADLGRVMDGDPLILELLRVHALFVGGTGSGKSSALWTLLDWLTSCRDVIVYGIDLTGGPVFRAWGGCIRQVATDADAARDLLERFIRLSKARADRLGERAEPRPGGPPPGDENWDPAVDGPAYVLVIDEYPVLADARIDGKPARLADLVTTLERIGRKTATQAMLAAQRAGKGDLGNTTVKAMTEVQGLLPCAAGDVDMLWPGRRSEGWRPDLLKGASGRRANDAGKVYLNAAGHDEPRTSRFYRLTVAEIHRRAIKRMEAGLPEPDEYSARAWDSGEDITDLIERDVPKLLSDLLGALDVHQVDGLPSAAAVAHLVEVDPDDYADIADLLPAADAGPDETRAAMQRAQMALARRLAVHGLSTAQLGGPGNPRGYRRADIQASIDGTWDPLPARS